MSRRHLQIEANIECHGKDVAIFEETDIPQSHKIGTEPPARSLSTWAWAFTNAEEASSGIDTIYIGFKTKQDAINDAWEYRYSMMEPDE